MTDPELYQEVIMAIGNLNKIRDELENRRIRKIQESKGYYKDNIIYIKS